MLTVRQPILRLALLERFACGMSGYPSGLFTHWICTLVDYLPLMFIHKPVSSPRTYIPFFALHAQINLLHLRRTSALTPTNWRHQRLMLHSVTDPNPLSSLMLPTGLAMYSQRPPSPYIPRYTSFAFHPMEMLYAVGGPDGTGAFPQLLTWG